MKFVVCFFVFSPKKALKTTLQCPYFFILVLLLKKENIKYFSSLFKPFQAFSSVFADNERRF